MLIAGAAAEASAPRVSKKATASQSSKVGTSHRFEGQMVGGKGQAPLEALSEVENEKSIDSLIGIRKNFSDRSEKAKGLR
jgi:hypothetical protein